VDGFSAWLVAGATAPVGTAVAVITANTVPLLRLTANPEIIVRDAPLIEVG